MITFQLLDWRPDGQHYDLRHIQLKPDGETYSVRVRSAESWAITHAELTSMVEAAGFRVAWHSPEQTGFGQHLLTGTPE